MRQRARKRWYLINYGYVWSLSTEQYKKFLKNAMEGKSWNLNSYGKELKRKPKNFFWIKSLNVTDLTPSQATEEYDWHFG